MDFDLEKFPSGYRALFCSLVLGQRLETHLWCAKLPNCFDNPLKFQRSHWMVCLVVQGLIHGLWALESHLEPKTLVFPPPCFLMFCFMLNQYNTCAFCCHGIVIVGNIMLPKFPLIFHKSPIEGICGDSRPSLYTLCLRSFIYCLRSLFFTPNHGQGPNTYPW